MLAGLALALILAFAPAGASAAATSNGGITMNSNEAIPVKKAKIVNGHAVAPSSAPARVKKVIRAANRIDDKPYIYGGGHRKFKDKGYDCSGAVSFALRGGRFISSPMPSTSYMRWKKPGEGAWITVYSNPGHAYMVVAGLRFDTSMTDGDGPGWSSSMRSTSGRFTARHPRGY